MLQACKQIEAYSSSSSPSSFTASSTSSLALAFGAFFFFLVPLAFFPGTASSSSSPSSETALPLRPFLALPPSVSSVLRFCGMCQWHLGGSVW
jgi:hypothetical protein